MLGNLSIWHILLFLGIVVLVFGTSKLKNAGRDLGGAIRGFKEAMREGEQSPPPQQLTQQKTDNQAANNPASDSHDKS